MVTPILSGSNTAHLLPLVIYFSIATYMHDNQLKSSSIQTYCNHNDAKLPCSNLQTAYEIDVANTSLVYAVSTRIMAAVILTESSRINYLSTIQLVLELTIQLCSYVASQLYIKLLILCLQCSQNLHYFFPTTKDVLS